MTARERLPLTLHNRLKKKNDLMQTWRRNIQDFFKSYKSPFTDNVLNDAQQFRYLQNLFDGDTKLFYRVEMLKHVQSTLKKRKWCLSHTATTI